MNANGSYARKPLVSVVITCYNHGVYLRDAIDSVLAQRYSPIEAIVVDDGSTDNTREVVSGYGSAVKYFHQQNKGLSAARNAGIDVCNGEFVVFLDADDWLYEDAININVQHMVANPTHGFVSGWHDKVDEYKYPFPEEEQSVVESDHYQHLLRGNYIGMHATVMYRKSVLVNYRFDETLRACEDYDVYFRIARNHPVGAHTKKIAAYRIHGNNMSSKIPFMLEHVLKVCKRQQAALATNDEKKAYAEGVKNWNDYYSEKLYNLFMFDPARQTDFPNQKEAGVLLRNKPFGFMKISLKKTREAVKSSLKQTLPDSLLKRLHNAGMYKHYTPPPGHVQPGDFNRTTPFSYDFGFDRGGAIDRHYIEKFLADNQEAICGRVLEIGDNEYTLKFGGQRVTKSEILHVDKSNEKATYIGDITRIPEIPDDTFDCIVLTQTLHLIYDFKAALATCYRILKPGGSLLLTVPGISHIDHGLWKDYWLWAFTDKSISRLLKESFTTPPEIQTYGNVYAAAAFLYGMGLPEFDKKQLMVHDPSYQLIIAARAIK